MALTAERLLLLLLLLCGARKLPPESAAKPRVIWARAASIFLLKVAAVLLFWCDEAIGPTSCDEIAGLVAIKRRYETQVATAAQFVVDTTLSTVLSAREFTRLVASPKR